ncbi:MAG: dihydroorotate dehydrogenase electron transfer subunit [Clostridia bacterium]|nr:dihydroorotate dehydrogenase electron transfer subunit [Clostridia bacterium]
MIKAELTVKSNRQIADRTWEMILETPSGMTDDFRPGQFINIRIDGLYLRRPISICDWSDDTVTIVYKTVGRGTEAMSRIEAGAKIDVLLPLGNGYNTEAENVGERPVLIGGGAGVPLMYCLCRRLVSEGVVPAVVLGFRTAGEMFYIERFREMNIEVAVATEDGSYGVKGFVTDVMSDPGYTSFFACGPEGMLRAVDRAAKADIPGWFSFEERMGCGFGACMGCSCETKYGSKRICKDGPVLERGEIIW